MRNLFLLAAIGSCAWAADPQRGSMVIGDAGCLECHTVRGQGAGHEPSGAAPELGSGLVPAYTVPALAAAVWNHTPAMLAGMPERRIDRPALTAADWEDLFAYLYSVQFLEFPAEVNRGKQAFQSKQCSGCHSLAESAQGPGKPVARWAPLNDPLALVYQMWSHSSTMDLAGRDAPWTSAGWTKMTGRDFMDLSVYFQQVQALPRETAFTLPKPASGMDAFDMNCGTCHAGPLALETGLKNSTWTDIGAGMWNHVQLMRKAPVISEPELRSILAYVWELQYRGPEGNAAHGRQAFTREGCASCHQNRPLGKTVTPASIAAIGWGEGRKMHARIVASGTPWPHLQAQDVADIVAYMNSLGAK